MFSTRTHWNNAPNRLSQALETRRRSGKPIFDLTLSNPTQCGFDYPEKEILSALATREVLEYRPEARGLSSARDAVAAYYRQKNLPVDPSRIVLTASTSEAYSLLFKLLCESRDNVLVPRPSYPLFEYLATVNDVSLSQYRLCYDESWKTDLLSIRDAITPRTRAIILVHPHNPTGMFLKNEEFAAIRSIARQHGLKIIVDEVFIDYAFAEDEERLTSTAGESDVLTFTLNGISKACGLPQMKLGWIVSSGERESVAGAIDRLEILCDTFLSVNTPVQLALPVFLEQGKVVRRQILGRIRSNNSFFQSALLDAPLQPLSAEGGWYCSFRMPRTKSDEEWALDLLEEKGIYLYPGFYFDLEEESCLVLSLLTEEVTFQSALNEIKTSVLSPP